MGQCSLDKPSTRARVLVMVETCAVVDIGTLKVKCLIASISPGKNLKQIYSSNTLTCFGCDMDANGGNVLEENLKKTIQELKRIKVLLKKYDARKYRIVSTHAMRRAKNKKEILARIKKEVGIDVENISQEEEAELFFKAVMKDFDSQNHYAVVDVGGGSVQILIGNPYSLEKIHMMQTGSAFLHDNFTENSNNENAFTRPKDIEKMKAYILKELLPLEKDLETPIIYGSSSIIDLMQAIELPLDPHESSKSHLYKTYAKHLDAFINRMLPLPYVEREKLFDFQKGYMWGIDKAFLNITILTDHLKSPYIIPSNANIAQGFIYSMLK